MGAFLWWFLIIQSFEPNPEQFPLPMRFFHIGPFATLEKCRDELAGLVEIFGTSELYKKCHEHSETPRDVW